MDEPRCRDRIPNREVEKENGPMQFVYLDFAVARISHFITGGYSTEMAAARWQMIHSCRGR